ncbi:uncharacterized protein PV09_00107 [Verruconis gallopava]|uniref:alpha-1,2-Mannosidase n=1 Tax=Verruconis gallopava TaxID=253628 RepID=A0A0D1Y298_9PEZI|nr:uncharacterized protein PV09_00107 [Verruconis gallopava]KIW09176.1 hypothetical protein PV09_00107 [Verruconis gallopava]
MIKLRRAFPARRASTRRRLVLAFFLGCVWWIITSVLFAAPITPEWAERAVTPGERADVVKEVFKSAWEGYYKHAFPNDELHPLLNTYGNSRNGWGASAVEALGTAAIMEAQDIVDTILDFIPTIDFHRTKTPVNLFETTIRYLGGMLSAYDLLTGPVHHLVRKRERVEPLLVQSQKLAEALKFAFKTPTGVPWKVLFLEKQESDGNPSNSAAAVGSLELEWTRLSELTGLLEYRTLVQKAMKPMLNPRPKRTEPFPGIIGNWINVNTGQFTDAWGSWGPGGDSFYEYLIKMYAYDQTSYDVHKDRWIVAAKSVMNVLAETPRGSNLKFITTTDGKSLDHLSSHLECFAGGNFILASKVLNDSRYLDFGLELTESCHEMYVRTATRIGPERIGFSPEGWPKKQKQQLEDLGFVILDPSYQLRPETMESYYYAYRATKDPKYQEWAWDTFVAIVTHTKVRNGFAPISNVNRIRWNWKFGRQESFFFSELLKYAYLIFADEAEYQFNYDGLNNWVFNTEGHPLKVTRPW